MVEKLKELRDWCILQQATWTNDLIECGEFTYGRPIVHQWDKETRLTVGKFCSIGGNVHILLGGEHHTEWLTTYPFDVFLDEGVAKSKGDVKIGNGVWIGNDVTILSGVKIGDGAVIGACSLIAKDVRPYAIMRGNPAEFLRYRYAAHSLQLNGITWWDWPIEKIAAGWQILTSEDVDRLMDFDRRWNNGLRDHA